MEAVAGIFKIPFDRVDITRDGIEIRERHRDENVAVYEKERLLEAARQLLVLARMLRV
ncbi:MAG TPA: hypothetical protein PKI19_10430 [Elusimicrobiales bacterium]|nr:hypothetical protein [Elusimicrobiales bacterium]